MSVKLNVSSFLAVETLKPAVGVNGIGFAAHVGQFDSLLDTISNERPFNPFEGRKLEAAEDLEAVEKDINDGLFASVPLESSKSVLGLLKSRHNCHT